MKHNGTKLGEGNESADSVLANYLTEFELRHLNPRKASSMTDVQPELLQLLQALRNDFRIVEMGSLSKLAQLDHGQTTHFYYSTHLLTPHD